MSHAEFKDMVEYGAKLLTQNVDLINALNVFPVPDGDTGTNMNMSFLSGLDYMQKETSASVGACAHALSRGLLMGARGNSGVILSQIFRGFARPIKDKKTVNGTDFVHAFAGGVEAAYRAVMKPVEGTILTVAREAAIQGERKAQTTDNIIEIMEAIVDGASRALDKTPELLPVLKEVGVVDSGGKGLLCIYEGFLASLRNEDLPSSESIEESELEALHAHKMFEKEEAPVSLEDLTYGYCTEMTVKIGQGPTVVRLYDEKHFKDQLGPIGDSQLVVSDGEIVKVHLHTEQPGKVMSLGQEFGELISVKVDNMREQVRELERKEAELQKENQSVSSEKTKDIAVIAVAAGQGVVDLFKSLGVDGVIEGGQTMNPSTQDFIDMIEKTPAKQYLLLPNNKNIVMAAEQVQDIIDQEVMTIKTTTIPEGITAMLGYNPEASLSDNYDNMLEHSQMVTSGQITFSIRDTEIDGLVIKENDFMGIVGGDIKVSTPSIEETLKQTLSEMIDDDSEIVTIIVGEEGNMSLAEAMEDEFPDMDIEVYQGDQPVYHYVLAVE